MHCPYCQNDDTRVVDSRVADDGLSIRRRRICSKCDKRFTTTETMSLLVQKRDGQTQPFDKNKLLSGTRKACQGRPIDEAQLHKLVAQVEGDLRSRGVAIIDSYEVGLALLEPLREVDEVAYIRYASVYRGFNTLDDFEAEIKKLKKAHPEKPAGRAKAPTKVATSKEASDD